MEADLLGETLVLWRTGGEVVAWKDLCIHRGSKLSLGWVKDGQIVCPYHGWHYDRTGACTLMPAHPEIRPPAKARTIRVPGARGLRHDLGVARRAGARSAAVPGMARRRVPQGARGSLFLPRQPVPHGRELPRRLALPLCPRQSQRRSGQAGSDRGFRRLRRGGRNPHQRDHGVPALWRSSRHPGECRLHLPLSASADRLFLEEHGRGKPLLHFPHRDPSGAGRLHRLAPGRDSISARS